jgi:hypothetical protein
MPAVFDVAAKTVSTRRQRYADFPEPDVDIGESARWEPSRAEEIQAWEAQRAGRGHSTVEDDHVPRGYLTRSLASPTGHSGQNRPIMEPPPGSEIVQIKPTYLLCNAVALASPTGNHLSLLLNRLRRSASGTPSP